LIMTSIPHNLANVPAWQLEEEQVTRAIYRTEKNIKVFADCIAAMCRKNDARRLEIARQRVRRLKGGTL